VLIQEVYSRLGKVPTPAASARFGPFRPALAALAALAAPSAQGAGRAGIGRQTALRL